MPCFRSCPSPSQVALGFVVSVYLVVHNLPQLLMQAVLVSDGSFVFCCWRRFSRWQAPAKGPRSQGLAQAAELIRKATIGGFPSDEGKGTLMTRYELESGKGWAMANDVA